MYYTMKPRGDGFGAQFQTFIYGILFVSSFQGVFVYRPLTQMEHNYDNKDDFLDKIEDLMNIKNNYININQLHNEKVQEVSFQMIQFFVEKNLEKLIKNEGFTRFKQVFWSNKDRDHFKNKCFNVAVHVRRPNPHDNRITGANTSNLYYLRVIDVIRKKYKEEKLIFHIYSQGDLSLFNDFISDDTILHIDEDITTTFIGLVAAEALVTSASSFSYAAALMTDGDVYYLPFWHPKLSHWIVV